MAADAWTAADTNAGTLDADIVVIGAGPAGIAAAVSAAASGARVLLVDEAPRPGGQLWRHRGGKPDALPRTREALPRAAARWLERLRHPLIRVAAGVTIVDAARGPGATIALAGEADGRAVRVEAARAVVIAAGARERFVPFPGWTLPGVIGAGGTQALLKAGLEVEGRRAVVAGSGPLLLPVAALLRRRAARVLMVAEQAPFARLVRFGLGRLTTPRTLLHAARYRIAFAPAPYRAGHWVLRAEGDGRLERVTITDGTRRMTLHCDLLCTGYGLVPATELPRLLGCAVQDDDDAVLVDEEQCTTVRGVYCAGESTGIAGADAAIVEGRIAGHAAAGDSAAARALLPVRRRHQAFGRALAHTFALRAELRDLAADDTIVCRCEDVTRGQMAAFGSAREARLHARAAMGPCQGRTCGPVMQHLFGWNLGSVRPPAVPAAVSTLAAAHAGATSAHHNPPPDQVMYHAEE